MTVNSATVQTIEKPKAKSTSPDKRRHPWWYHAVHDPYERINVWSHGIPGILFITLGCLLYNEWIKGYRSLSVFCMCAATTHMLSAITHCCPESSILRKMDHLGILALLIGTPVTALWVMAPEVSQTPLKYIFTSAFISAFLPRISRTIGFIICGAALFVFYGSIFYSWNALAQSLMYLSGGICYIRSQGYSRPQGFADHHFLHYFVTIACVLHCHLLASY